MTTKDKTIDFLKVHNSVIVCNNKAELAYVLAWCDEQGKEVAGFMRTINKFPFCLGVSSKIVSWVDEMDRAVYYVDFMDFLNAVTDKDKDGKNN
jgi:hypothetical protein